MNFTTFYGVRIGVFGRDVQGAAVTPGSIRVDKKDGTAIYVDFMSKAEYLLSGDKHVEDRKSSRWRSLDGQRDRAKGEEGTFILTSRENMARNLVTVTEVLKPQIEAPWRADVERTIEDLKRNLVRIDKLEERLEVNYMKEKMGLDGFMKNVLESQEKLKAEVMEVMDVIHEWEEVRDKVDVVENLVALIMDFKEKPKMEKNNITREEAERKHVNFIMSNVEEQSLLASKKPGGNRCLDELD